MDIHHVQYLKAASSVPWKVVHRLKRKWNNPNTVSWNYYFLQQFHLYIWRDVKFEGWRWKENKSGRHFVLEFGENKMAAIILKNGFLFCYSLRATTILLDGWLSTEKAHTFTKSVDCSSSHLPSLSGAILSIPPEKKLWLKQSRFFKKRVFHTILFLILKD